MPATRTLDIAQAYTARHYIAAARRASTAGRYNDARELALLARRAMRLARGRTGAGAFAGLAPWPRPLGLAARA